MHTDWKLPEREERSPKNQLSVRATNELSVGAAVNFQILCLSDLRSIEFLMKKRLMGSEIDNLEYQQFIKKKLFFYLVKVFMCKIVCNLFSHNYQF